MLLNSRRSPAAGVTAFGELKLEADSLPGEADVHPDHRASARNLLHYLALRRHDIRDLQEQLGAMGLSSLGRTESHVFSALHGVMDVLARLDGSDAPQQEPNGMVALAEGQRLLEKNTDTLLGPAPDGRRVRIMVTMPSEAGCDYALVRDLVASGMNCMRINCAHERRRHERKLPRHNPRPDRHPVWRSPAAPRDPASGPADCPASAPAAPARTAGCA